VKPVLSILLAAFVGWFLPSACASPDGSEPPEHHAVASIRSIVPRAVPLRDRFARGRLELLRAINHDRAAAGLQPVVLDSLATLTAQRHAEAMATGGYLSHYDLAGRPPYERLAAVGGTAHVLENVYRWRERDEDPLHEGDVWNGFEPRTAEAALLASDPHRAVILDPHRTGVGIGFAVDPRERAVFVVQDFVARHAAVVPPRSALRGAPARVWGKVLTPDLRPLLVVVRREPAIPSGGLLGSPPRGPYNDGGDDPRFVPPWAFAVLPDGTFALDLAAELSPGRYYAILYVAPSREVEVALARRRAYPGQGWPGAAVVFEVLAS
jgi:uncharacterized protein YkwD